MRSERRRDAGMVSVELAAALPVLVLVLAVALSAVAVIAARVRCEDAAREAARAAARGDAAVARRLALDAAPGAHVSVVSGAEQVEATVRQVVHPLGSWLPAVTVSERAVAAREPTTAVGRSP